MIKIHTQTPPQRQLPNALITALLEVWHVRVCKRLSALLCVCSKGSVEMCELFFFLFFFTQINTVVF